MPPRKVERTKRKVNQKQNKRFPEVLPKRDCGLSLLFSFCCFFLIFPFQRRTKTLLTLWRKKTKIPRGSDKSEVPVCLLGFYSPSSQECSDYLFQPLFSFPTFDLLFQKEKPSHYKSRHQVLPRKRSSSSTPSTQSMHNMPWCWSIGWFLFQTLSSNILPHSLSEQEKKKTRECLEKEKNQLYWLNFLLMMCSWSSFCFLIQKTERKLRSRRRKSTKRLNL